MKLSQEALRQCKISSLPIDQALLCLFIEHYKDSFRPDLFWRITCSGKNGMASIGPPFSFRFENEEDKTGDGPNTFQVYP